MPETLIANVAVPLYFPQPLLALGALVPIIAIEMILLRRKMHVSWRNVSIANVFSTLLGIPVAFVCVAALGMSYGVFLDHNYTRLSDAILVMAAATVPCFVLSVLIEGNYLQSRVDSPDDRSFWFAVIKAHCFSYLALMFLYCLWLSVRLSS